MLFHHDPLHSDGFLDELAVDVAGRMSAMDRAADWATFATERQELAARRVASGEPAAS
jgi:hypothetical protein